MIITPPSVCLQFTSMLPTPPSRESIRPSHRGRPLWDGVRREGLWRLDDGAAQQLEGAASEHVIEPLEQQACATIDGTTSRSGSSSAEVVAVNYDSPVRR